MNVEAAPPPRAVPETDMPTPLIALLCATPLGLVIWDFVRELRAADEDQPEVKPGAAAAALRPRGH
jgi:hypothetical protein